MPQRNKSPRALILGGLVLALVVVALVLNVGYLRDLPVRRHLQRGAAYVRAGQADQAEKEWRAALRLDPKRSETYRALSRFYISAQRPDMALPLLEHLRAKDPKSPHTLCSLAEAYALLDNQAKMQEVAQAAAKAEPDCATAHAMLGVALGQQLETRGAIAALTKARELAPADDKIAISLAQAYLDAADLQNAEKIARETLARNPGYATAYYTLGRAYARRTPTPDNLREAIRAFEKSVELNPAWGDAFGELGRLRVLAGDFPGALKALNYVWSRGVRTEEAAFNMATAYRKIGDKQKAAQFSAEFKRLSDFATKYEALRKRLSLQPDNPDIALQLAELELQAGNLPQAEDLLTGILRLRPRDGRALKAAVSLYDKKGDKTMADAFRHRLASASPAKQEAL